MILIVRKHAKLFAKLFIIFSISLLSACSTVGENLSFSSYANYDFYTVRHNDTMKKIAAKFNVTQNDLIKSNNLRAPYELKAGQRLKVLVPPLTAVQSKALPLMAHSLLWPTQGRIIRTFATANNGSKGIEIAGALGQEIRASSNGKVVYSGSSLTGYGKAIIIKHNDSVVTVYALNQLLLVKEGQIIKAGEKIATMGSNAQGDVVLHFEVRIDGTPQNPLLYLEKKGIN